MENYKKEFIHFALQNGMLSFGEFKLKSGRISPYFFNVGSFNDGRSLAKLGELYAQLLLKKKLGFDMLFGPAYKGIPLVSATAIALHQHHKKNVSWCFNRKEIKDHGEGGTIVGAKLQGRVVIIDDVITAGTAIDEVIPIITKEAEPVAILVAIDRQERAKNSEHSSVYEISKKYSLPVISIITCEDIMQTIETNEEMMQHYDALKAYKKTYGARVSE